MKVERLKQPVLPEGATKHDIDCAIAQMWEDEGNLEQALAVANGVLDENPDNAWALLLAGRICVKMKKCGLAYTLLRRALERANRVDIKINLASACIGMHRLDEAKKLLQDVRREAPNHYGSLSLLCMLAVWDCNPRLAIDLGNKSLAIKPDHADAHESVGYAHLMLGEWEKGWYGYEQFIGKSKYRPNKPPHEGCPYWDGKEGLDIYVRGEQGIGDEISFASILQEFVGKHKKVTFDCDEKLGGLFARSFPDVEVIATRKQKNDGKEWLKDRKFDAHCLIGSLAYHYRKQDSDFPGTPFLVADHERRIQWKALLDRLPGKKVGIAWSGGSKGTFQERRSLPLEGLLPILKTEGVSWVSLQYKDHREEIEALEQKHGIKVHHWARAAESDDYDDQAALVSELDLVITVCTAVVHLAGSLGKTAWVLVPSKPRWWYGLKGRKSPWYSSIEYFRQEEDWPLEEVAQRLKEFVQ